MPPLVCSQPLVSSTSKTQTSAPTSATTVPEWAIPGRDLGPVRPEAGVLRELDERTLRVVVLDRRS